MEIQTHIEIDAPPRRVWAVLTDFEGYPAWNPFITQARGTARAGARLKVRIEPPGGRAGTFTPVVTEAVPERSLAWLGTLGAAWVFAGAHQFRLEPLPGGGTRFVHSETFGGLLVRLVRRSLETSTRRGFEAMNAALKAEAEKG